MVILLCYTISIIDHVGAWQQVGKMRRICCFYWETYAWTFFSSWRRVGGGLNSPLISSALAGPHSARCALAMCVHPTVWGQSSSYSLRNKMRIALQPKEHKIVAQATQAAYQRGHKPCILWPHCFSLCCWMTFSSNFFRLIIVIIYCFICLSLLLCVTICMILPVERNYKTKK